MKKWMLVLVLGISASAAAGCDDTPIPAVGKVSYRNDVQPILTARCARCHGAGGALNADPYAESDGTTQGNTVKQLMGKPLLGYFDCGPGDRGSMHGFGYYAVGQPGHDTWLSYKHVMPPPPSPELTDREAEILDRWQAAPDNSSTCSP